MREARRAGLVAALTVSAAISLPACGATEIEMTTATTPSTSAEQSALPPMQRFRIGGEVYGPVQDCTVAEASVTCTADWDHPYQADTYAGTFTGTLSGRQITGTSTTRQTGRDATDPDCWWQSHTSATVTYILNSDGTVTARTGAGEWRMTRSGSCSGTESGTSSPAETGTGLTWTVID